MPSANNPESPPHPAWYLVLLVSAGLCSLAIAFFVKGGIGDMNRLEERKQALKQKIKENKQTYRRLKNRERRLHQDPYLIEKLARKKLGLGRPGEKRIQLSTEGETVTESPKRRDRSGPPKRID
jgi:cell division protein FtsB